MSSILSQDTEEKGAKRTSGESDPLVRAVEVVLEEAESNRSAKSSDRGIVRPFLLVDLGAALSSIRKRRSGEMAEAVESTAEEALQTGMNEIDSTSGQQSQGRRSGGSSGRGMLSKLFLVGAIVGLGYVMRKRSGSVGEAVTQATDRAREVADETEMRSGEMAQRTESVAGEAADRIEETGEAVSDQAADRVRESGEMAADRVQEGGEMASDEIEGAADTAEEAEQQAEEKMDESGDEE